MNLIGKIFVLVILLMSLLFMTLAMAVYATHRNWKEQYTKLQTSYSQLDSKAKQDDSAAKLREANLQSQLDSALVEVGKLQSDREALIARNEDIATEVNLLKQERRDATAAVTSTQANAERLSGENGVLRQNVIASHEAADAAFQATLEATSERQQAEVALKIEEQENLELTDRVADMTAVMLAEGLDPNTRVGDTKPRVGGFVSSIRRRGGDETIEITIGSDDGIKPEHTVEIFRMTTDPGQSKWLGRAVVLSTDGDRAFARILPNLKKGHIQEGDRVATRLN